MAEGSAGLPQSKCSSHFKHDLEEVKLADLYHVCPEKPSFLAKVKINSSASPWPCKELPPPQPLQPLSPLPGHSCSPPAADLFKCMLWKQRSKSSRSLTARFISKYCPIYLHVCPKPSYSSSLSVISHLVSCRNLLAGPLLLPPASTVCSPQSGQSDSFQSKSEYDRFQRHNISLSRPQSLQWPVRALTSCSTHPYLSDLLQPSLLFFCLGTLALS